jgi:hypothetical protein
MSIGTVMARPLRKLVSMLCWNVAKALKDRLSSTVARMGVPGIILQVFAISFWTACHMRDVSVSTNAQVPTKQFDRLVHPIT